MNDDRPSRRTGIFLRASALEGEARIRFLDDACAGDADLRAEIDSLLRHDLGTTELRLSNPSGQSRPDRVDEFRILDVLGEGGMGVVYLAEQFEPIHRRVALKLIKVGMDTKQVVARFEAERQALALMNHAYVAQVFDAGATSEGRPYFVMEHVSGVPITEHCDRQRLTTRERLELFCLVCEGVQHAHQKAIIHRDLKPSNVLVAIQGDKAIPKVIDFGVAKATAQRLTERTVYTETGVMMGTPEYMSPEQADLGGDDVDTRTDVYSLGVMLYELLTGALPLDPKELRAAGFDEILRRIREDDPPRPSTRISTLGRERSTASARSRNTDVSTLRRQLTGDLDWIAMKALEKDRARRYGSPAELASDIRRHLEDQPVHARPPSVVYQLRKLARRRKGWIAATGLVALSLVAGLSTTTVMFLRSRAAEQLAVREKRAAERTSYKANLLAASLALKASDTEGATLRLLDCPPELRGLEWSRLRHLAASEVAVLRGTDAVFSPDGWFILTIDGDEVLRWDTRAFQGTSVEGVTEILARGDVSQLLGVSPDAAWVLVLVIEPGATPGAGTLQLVRGDLKTKRRTSIGPPKEFRIGDAEPGFPFSDDRLRIAIVEDQAHEWIVSVFDTRDGRKLADVRVPKPPEPLTGDTWGDLTVSLSSPARLLTAGAHGRVSVWDTGTPRPALVWDLSTDSVTAADLEGQVAAVGHFDGNISRWEITGDNPGYTWLVHGSSIAAIDLSADGNTILSADEDRFVKLWLRSSPRPAAKWIARGDVDSVRLSPDGSLATASYGGRTSVWQTAAARATFKGSGISALSVSPDGRAIAFGLQSHEIEIYDTQSHRATARISLAEPAPDPAAANRPEDPEPDTSTPIRAVRFTPDGARLVSGDAKGAFRIHDAGTVKILETFFLRGGPISAIDVSPDGRWAALGLHGGVVQVRDLTEEVEPRQLRKETGAIAGVAFSPDGKQLAWGGNKGLAVWNMDIERVAWSVQGDERISGLCFDREGRRLVASLGGGSKGIAARVWNAATGEKIADLASGRSDEGINVIAFSPDGRRIVAGTGDGLVHVFASDTYELLVSLEAGLDPSAAVEALAFTPSGDHLIIGRSNGDVDAWARGRDPSTDLDVVPGEP